MQQELAIQTACRDHLMKCLKDPRWVNHPDYEMLKEDYYKKIMKYTKFIIGFELGIFPTGYFEQSEKVYA